MSERARIDGSPILVTGMHRSGTSWLGEMLSAGGNVVNIQEPLNVGNRQTILGARVQRWYTYISAENEDDFLPYYLDAIALRIRPVDDIRRIRLGSPRDPARIPAKWLAFARGRRAGARVLFKDPFAILSADWFRNRLDCSVVVIVRHPAAVVSSLQRLNYDFDFRDLRDQPVLMNDRLGRFRDEIENACAGGDVIEHGALLWKILYELTDGWRRDGESMIVVRHEDLSTNPLEEFQRLYAALDLDFNDRAAATIERFTSDRNPADVAPRRYGSIPLDSRASVASWTRRLTAEDVARVEAITRDVWPRYYAEDEWFNANAPAEGSGAH